MKKNTLILTPIVAALALTACGGSDSVDTKKTEEKVQETIIYGPLSTGSMSEPQFVYFDLETMTEVTLTEAEAKTNSQWDIAFKRGDIYLSNTNSDAPVSVYATDKNSDFFDSDGNAIVERFTSATPESELADFEAVTLKDIPSTDEEFSTDTINRVLDGFYSYNSTTHVVTADNSHAYIVNSDSTFSKFKATALTTSGRDLAEITLTYSNQTNVDNEFSLTESNIVVNTSEACAGFDGVYVDFELGQVVSSSDAWDISLPCNEAKTAASFEINLAEDATAMQDFNNKYAAIDPNAMSYYDFEQNVRVKRAFDAMPWYQYGLNGGHTLWSQYGVYIIKTATANYKLQLTSYYNADNESGNISFRAQAL